ncbi:MAG: large subunit ribosomal protein [Acidobacteriota bacterium]|jgi:large subunit ribosomal protein L15|nr:large subunit ribosomal protein [Acidobacteriota bacterium]
MAIGLNNLKPAAGSTHKKKRVGRGPGSGLGKTAGRGNKGQKSRSGYSGKVGFEGGQMPLQRRLPKRGFTNIFKKQWIEVTLATLEQSFGAGDEITPETMHSRGVIAKGKRDIVVLGTGDITKALTVSAHRFTKGARQKIEAAGGTVNVISLHHKPDALVPVSE